MFGGWPLISPWIQRFSLQFLVPACRFFPFCLGWKPLPCPARICICFIVTDIDDRLIWVDVTQASKILLFPNISIFLHPISRRVPSPFLYQFPTISKPVSIIFISTILHELHIFAIGYRCHVHFEGLQVYFMLWKLIIVAKGIAVVPNLKDPPWNIDHL